MDERTEGEIWIVHPGSLRLHLAFAPAEELLRIIVRRMCEDLALTFYAAAQIKLATDTTHTVRKGIE